MSLAQRPDHAAPVPARTHRTHDPLRWTYQAIDSHAPTGERPPRHGAI